MCSVSQCSATRCSEGGSCSIWWWRNVVLPQEGLFLEQRQLCKLCLLILQSWDWCWKRSPQEKHIEPSLCQPSSVPTVSLLCRRAMC